MVDITILELNLEGASFEANAPGSGASPVETSSSGGLGRFLGGSDDESGSESASRSEPADSGGRNPLPIVIGLAAVVLGLVVLRRLVGGEAEPIPA